MRNTALCLAKIAFLVVTPGAHAATGRAQGTNRNAPGFAPAATASASDQGPLPAPNQYNTAPVTASWGPSTVNEQNFECGPWMPAGGVNPSNPFQGSYGQCVYWAIEKRPDLWENSSDHNTSDWNASDWVALAQAAGYTVNGTPAVGDIAAAPYPGNHVAYVEQLNSGGSIIVSEMNSNYPGQGDWAYLSPDDVAQISFIQLPAPGQTPPSGTTPSGSPAPSAGQPAATPGTAPPPRNPALRWRSVTRQAPTAS